MSTGHTPGPWRVSKRNPRIVIGNGPGWTGVAKVGINGTTAGKIDADARLIAAAPEMSAVIRRLLNAFDRHSVISALEDARINGSHGAHVDGWKKLVEEMRKTLAEANEIHDKATGEAS